MTRPEPVAEHAELARLRAENERLQRLNREAFAYIRAKVDDLLDVVGTRTLRPEELDDQGLVTLDPIGIVATTFRHILENVRETNRQLQLAHSEIETIFNTVGSAVLVVDPERRIVSFNRQAAKLLIGHDRDVCGHFCYQVLCEADPVPEECVFLQVVNSGREAVIRGKPLRDRFYDVVAAPSYDDTGKLLHVVMAYHDVTEARRVERMKSEFVSTAAHELRSPLATIMGYADLLLDGPELDPQQRRDYLELILNRSEHLAHIVSDLLDISRIEAGEGLKLTFEPCRLDLLCREAAWEHEAAGDGHPFEFDLPADGAEIEGDHYALAQILENLISNAIKYSPKGGPIRIGLCRQPVGWELQVADRGIGMTPEQIAHIFEKFYRANSSDTAVPGTGLGMTIVKYLVDAHHGEIAIDSTPGAGTTVRILFPNRQPAAV
ncbi:MAG: PAS domain-containing protein [Deltaproteobacteria bacterium]|nr:MAG: PAS domain-containing protein [Deltaproteobacteria bacterium]